jgi:hypothetical protein
MEWRSHSNTECRPEVAERITILIRAFSGGVFGKRFPGALPQAADEAAPLALSIHIPYL